MTPRERILAVLHHEIPDRTPFDIWYTPEVLDQLKRYVQTDDEQDIWDALEIDKIVMLEAPYMRERSRVGQDGSLETVKTWGNTVRDVVVDSGGTYEETIAYPLSAVEHPADLGSFPWPDPNDFDYLQLKRSCIEHHRWIRMLTFISIFEIYCKLRPMDQSLMDLYINEELARELIARITEIQIAYIDRAFAACGPLLDIVYLSDDMGMQDRALIPIGKWEELFKPHYRRLIDHIHAAGAFVFYHTDGAAFDVLQQMVGLGVDIINPIQHSCPGMDREHLIDAFSDRVVFHGAVENQHILPFGTAQEVTDEVRIDREILGRYHRYICASCHNLQPGTPIENILAIYQADRTL